MKVRLLLTLALLAAIALTPSMLPAQESDHISGRDKVHDPTGAWLIRNDAEGSPFILTVFHNGGTLTGDLQGESAFVPGVKPPESVINSPESGVWQKTGWKTFAITSLTMEYDANAPFALFQFDKVQFTGFLNESGDRMEITAIAITTFHPDGSQKDFIPVSTKAHGVRIPLEILPFTSHTLPIPTIPTAPAP